jgi:alpha-mannosidase
MRISSVTTTPLFTGPAARPRQIVQVTLKRAPGPVTVAITGPGVSTPEPVVVTGDQVAEVGIEVAAPATPGSTRPVTVTADAGPRSHAERTAEVTLAEPGWTMWMVSHFHYDPVWWNTQGQFLQSRLLLPGDDGKLPDVRTAFELVALHLEEARRDPDYKFVLAETDYLKPHFDAHPEDRADLLEFIRQGRIELAGGSYNEPNTNLTCAESTIRNAVYGVAYQRDVLGGDPRTAWMLDAFGFDPAYPGLMAAAGMAASSWARGPFHQWGPGRTAGDNRLMQFPAEFEWVAPDGTGLLTSYMANHYSAGWVTQQATDLKMAELAAYQQFLELSPVAATRNVLLPVGGDHVVPSRWATAIHRDWNAHYTWPRFVTAVPGEFFAAVRAEATRGDVWITPQTRDMNPVYTGKDVSYIDTKQAQRQAETAVLDGERLATLAWLAGARYPAASLDKAWRLLVFGAHHDAITGTEGDQVYLDLLAGWREAWQRGAAARDAAAQHLAGLADTSGAPAGGLPVVVFNTQSRARSGMVTAVLRPPGRWIELRDDAGAPVPFLAEGAVRNSDGGLTELTVTFRARDVPGVGYRTYVVVPADPPNPAAAAAEAGWQPAVGTEIANDTLAVAADPARGGTLTSIRLDGTELLRGPGNELVLQPEHPRHPRWGEGPWLLCPAGPGDGSARHRARVRAERCPAGQRLVARLTLGELTVTQETLLWDGEPRVEFRTHVDGSIGQDRLLRVSFPVDVPGGLPVYQTAVSVIGRPPGPADTDVAQNEFTLDSPAAEWFGVGSVARISLGGEPGAQARTQAIGVAEVVAPPAAGRDDIRGLVAALGRAGVTATCSRPDGPRYGHLAVDSNLPDFRIALGGPEVSTFTAEVLAAAGPACEQTVKDQLQQTGQARVWVPAARSRASAFAAGADLRGPADLPVLIVAGDGPADLAAAIGAVTEDLADSVIEVPAGPKTPDTPDAAGGPATALTPRTVAILNRGTPSGLVTPDGTATMALMRACSTWPCGVWIDGPARTTPDGTSFAWQHWSHTFEYALAAGPGDWREAGLAAHGQDYNAPLLAVPAGRHAGPLPATASLVTVDPPAAILSALKPRGNPLAPEAGGGAPASPAGGVTVRLREAGHGPVPARVGLFTGLTAARHLSLTEDAPGQPVPLDDGAATALVPAAGVATLELTPAPWPAASAAGLSEPAQTTAYTAGPPEPTQPVFARYWLHGKGPAPAGNLPVAVHLSPARVTASSSLTGSLRLTVACGPEPAAGEIRLAVPAGLDVEPAGPLRYDLTARGHAAWDLAVRAGPEAAAGHYFVTAAITDQAAQQIEDAALVVVGPAAAAPEWPQPGLLAASDAELRAVEAEVEVTVASRRLRLAPGEAGVIEVTVASQAASEIRGEVQLISPAGSWPFLDRWTSAFSAAPGGRALLSFPVAAPADARPGQRWWVLAKVMYFGRARYAEPVEVIIG